MEFISEKKGLNKNMIKHGKKLMIYRKAWKGKNPFTSWLWDDTVV